MRILFFGTPEFAVPSLRTLKEAGHDICAVVTRQDKPKGRGMKTAFSPVKEYALTQDIPIFQPETLKDHAITGLLEKYRPELIVVVAYGRILPGYVLDFPPKGCVNVHGSLLPAYRGAAPIQWAVVNGERETGVTTMYMDRGIDTGDIILQAKTPIGSEETAGELHDHIMEQGAKLLLLTIRLIEQNAAPRTKQDDTLATFAPMLSRESGKIDWTQPAQSIANQVRGMSPWPGACTFCRDFQIKILKAAAMNGCGAPGSVLKADAGGVEVACGAGSLNILEMQPCGGKKMNAQAFCNGHEIKPGDVFAPDTKPNAEH